MTDETELHEAEHPGPVQLPIDGFFSDLATADMAPPRWVIKNVLPCGIVFLAGPPKTMKSTIEMALSLAVSGLQTDALPADMLELGMEPGTVMGLSAEASAGELRHMVEVGMGVKLPDDRRIIIADDPWSFRLDDPEALEQLMVWLKARRPRLFWLDPLLDFHSTDEKDSGAMNRLLRPIQRWAKENDSCFLVVHHTRKKSQEDKSDYGTGDMRGTTALFGIADGVIIITPRPGGKLYMKGTYKRGPEWEKTVVIKMWGQETEKTDNEKALMALAPFERRVLQQLSRNRPLASLIGAPPRPTQETLENASRRLVMMGLTTVKENKLELTPLGKSIATAAARESSAKTDTP